MLVAIAFVVLAGPSSDAKVLWEQVRKHYRALQGFTMEIEHRDSSGLFPGAFEQSLRWQAPNRFDLLVTKRSGFVPKPNLPGGTAPNYYCDGSDVLSVDSGGRRSRTQIATPNTMPGWEVSGGMILSWLMGTSASTMFENPPEGMTIALTLGETTVWKDELVREVVAKIGMKGSTESVSGMFYIDDEAPLLRGFEFKAGRQSGWARYLKQEEGPKFDKPVGAPPPGL